MSDYYAKLRDYDAKFATPKDMEEAKAAAVRLADLIRGSNRVREDVLSVLDVHDLAGIYTAIHVIQYRRMMEDKRIGWVNAADIVGEPKSKRSRSGRSIRPRPARRRACDCHRSSQ